jgi:uncharacterized protein (UPF0332 family)
MDIDRLLNDKEFLAKEVSYFLYKKHIIRIDNKALAKAHMKKARHNMSFYKLNKNHNEFNDWLIVILYYSLYHTALSLITSKGFSTKNHYATLLLLIKEYPITREEAGMISDLAITRNDAELYLAIKEERHKASYTSEIALTKGLIENFEDRIISFMNKAENEISTSHK